MKLRIVKDTVQQVHVPIPTVCQALYLLQGIQDRIHCSWTDREDAFVIKDSKIDKIESISPRLERGYGHISLFLARLLKLPDPSDQHWLGNLNNLASTKEIQLVAVLQP